MNALLSKRIYSTINWRITMYGRRFYFFIIINCLILGGIFFTINHTADLLKSNSAEIIFLNSFMLDGKEDNLKYRVLMELPTAPFTFTTEVTREQFKRTGSDINKLVIFQLVAHWYKVYWNGTLIGSVGNLQDDRSNIWNSLHMFDIDHQSIKDVNQIKLVVCGSYQLGVSNFPLLITKPQVADKFTDWFSIALLDIYYVILGMVLFALLLIICLFKPSNRLKQDFVYLSVAVISVLIFISDYLPWYHLPVDYLTYKKIVIFAMYFAAFAMSLAIYKRFRQSMNVVVGHLALFGAIFVIVFAKDIITFKQMWSVLNILILLNILGWIYTTWRFFKKSGDAKIIFQASVFMLVLSGIDVYYGLRGEFPFISMNIYGLLQFCFAMVMMIVFDYLDLQRKVTRESEKSKMMYQRAVRDGMTGLHNHQFIHSVLEKVKRPYSLIMLDIDNFKQFNDQYGHQAGDLVIKFVAENIQKTVRMQGIAGRYGGDEFVAILLKPEPERVKEFAENIQRLVEVPLKINSTTTVQVTLSIGIYVAEAGEPGDDALNKVDQALYYSKHQGKNQITDYREKN